MIPERKTEEDINEKLIYVLSALDDMGKLLTQKSRFATTAKCLLRLVLGTVGISRGAIYTYKHSRNILQLEASTFKNENDPASLQFPVEISSKFIDNSIPVPLTDLLETGCAGCSETIEYWQKSNVILLVPLAVHKEFIGLICLGTFFIDREFLSEDIEILRLLGRHVSLSFYNQNLLSKTQHANFTLNHKILELEQLYEIGLAITRLRSINDLSDEILSRAATILDARYGALWIQEAESQVLSSAFGFKTDSIPDLLKDAADATKINYESENPYVLSIPIALPHKKLGFLAVAGKESRTESFQRFKSSDRQLLEAFANQAAVALENARLYKDAVEAERIEGELKAALEIQRALLPSSSPEIPDLQVAASTVPCRTIGGDFYGFAPLADGRWAFTLADVSGKGIPAAMLVSTFHAVFNMLKAHLDNPVSTATQINEIIYSATPANKFITAVFLVWDPVTETLTSLSAGHESPLLIHRDGSSETLDAGGLVLGLLPTVAYQSGVKPFLRGDTLCLYTDGITDLRNPENELFGFERLKALITEHHTLPAWELLDKIVQATESFQESIPAPDDRTLMILRRND
jgi:phosphoserine phosphatase RsbU/P